MEVVSKLVLLSSRDKLSEFMESKGANSPGILTLTSGLSKVCIHPHVFYMHVHVMYIFFALHGGGGITEFDVDVINMVMDIGFQVLLASVSLGILCLCSKVPRHSVEMDVCWISWLAVRIEARA